MKFALIAKFVALAALVGNGTLLKVSRADAACDLHRPVAERSHDCIEFGDRRLRIPAGYFLPWHAGKRDDPSAPIRLIFPAGKTGWVYFIVTATLPDLSPLPELKQARRLTDWMEFRRLPWKEGRSGVEVTVFLREHVLGPKRVEFVSGEWVFAPGLASNLIAIGCARVEKSLRTETIHCPAHGWTFHLHLRQGLVSHFLFDWPGNALHACRVPYSAGIVLSVSVSADRRADTCMIALTMRDWLRSLEY